MPPLLTDNKVGKQLLYYKLLGSLTVPPGLLVLVLVTASIVACKKPRKKKLALFLLLLSSILWFAATPWGAYRITGKIEDRYNTPTFLPSSDTYILCLGGGSSYDEKGNAIQSGLFSLERVFCAVKIARQTNAPIIFSGGNVYGTNNTSEAETMAKAAKEMGFRGKIILEEKSRTTKENFRYSAALVQDKQNIIIVTNAFHMPRSIKLAGQYLNNKTLISYPSGRLTDPLYKGIFHLYPDANSLMVSCLGIKEYIGMAINDVIDITRAFYPSQK